MNTEIILQLVMIACAIALGYGVHELRHPAPKRGKGGRFIKRK